MKIVLFLVLFSQTALATKWTVGTALGPKHPGLVVSKQKQSQWLRFKTNFQPHQTVQLQGDWLRPRDIDIDWYGPIDFYAGLGVNGSSAEASTGIEEKFYLHFPLGLRWRPQDLGIVLTAEFSGMMGSLPSTGFSVYANSSISLIF